MSDLYQSICETNTNSLGSLLKDSNATIARNKENGYADLEANKKAFVFKYLEAYDLAEAASSVGVSRETARKWLREPLVSAFMSEWQQEMGQRSVISRDFVNQMWLKLLPKVMGEEEVAMVDKEGMQYTAKEFDAVAATRVLTELSKSTNFYNEGSGSKAAVTVNIDLSALGINQEKQIGVTIEGNVNASDSD
ncbi:MAG: terminase small subunit [Podoviridae sp. ctpVR23]|nr:MAG: terminase small subunit [Podoviridae sp. ctpVR23]